MRISRIEWKANKEVQGIMNVNITNDMDIHVGWMKVSFQDEYWSDYHRIDKGLGKRYLIGI